MIEVTIKEWNKNKSWTTWGEKARIQFTSRIKDKSSLSYTDIKRLSRGILKKEISSFQLDLAKKKTDADSVLHVLESLGADYEIKET